MAKLPRRPWVHVLLAAAILAAVAAASLRFVHPGGLRVIRPGRLYRCSAPPPAALLRQCDVSIVLGASPDGPREEFRRAAAAAGARFAYLPVAGEHPTDAEIEQFLLMVRRPGAVLLCGDDRRVALLVAAARVVDDGWPVRKAQAEAARGAPPTLAWDAATRKRLRDLRRDRLLWQTKLALRSMPPARPARPATSREREPAPPG